MAFTTKVYNHSAIPYFESQKNKARNDLCNPSSDIVRGSPQKRNDERRSTKKWVLKAFYSDSGATDKSPTPAGKDGKPSAPSACAAAPDRKQSAPLTNHGQEQSNPTDKVAQESRPQLSIRFTESLISSRADKFKFCLIGEFTDQARPKLSLVRRWVREKWALKGKWSLTLLDPSHILLRLENNDDMLLIWTRQKWVVQGHLMKVFRWSSIFPTSERQNTSLATVWVSFPRLPLVFFEEDLLHSIASLVGKVVAIDGQTRSLRRTDVARAWVEVDLSKELPKELWIGAGNSGFWQAINYKKLPSYCTNCCLQGHSTNRCKFSNIISRDSTGNRLLEDDEDRNSGKWAQFRSLFQDGEEDTISGTLSGHLRCYRGSITVGESFWRGILSEEEVAEGGAAAAEEHQRTNLGVEEEEGPTEVQNWEEVVVCDEEREKGKQEQVGKEDDRRAMEKKMPKRSREKMNMKPQQVFQPIVEKSNDKSLEETAPSRSNSREQRVRSQSEKKESEEGQSSELKVDVSDVDELPTQANYVETSNACEPHAPVRYSASDVKKMTKSFSKEIGRGGFGTVFVGNLRDGRTVAVKRLNRRGTVMEFVREVRIIGGRHHDNIVKLLGFCPNSSNRALIYEFMPNGSLDKYIDSPNSPNSLNTKQLHQIAVGVARGLDYLHGGPNSTSSVLHLDIKPANILLDENFCPKICDFGLAKEWATGEKQSFESTGGTSGYIAPEHLSGFKPTSKSDVYSYGVMLLEMAVGRRASKTPDLFEWTKENVNDQCSRGILKDDTARKMIVVGLRCVQADPEVRPSMSRVLKMLEGKLEDLEMPSRLRSLPTEPPFLVDSLELYLDKESWFFGSDGQIRMVMICSRR